jgi:flagellar basal-body rod protein FlgG
MQALYTAATGMEASTLNIDVIANNLANQNTNSFKRKRAEFQDLLYVTKQQVGAQTSNAGTLSPTGAHLGLGVKVAAIYGIFEQGPLQLTENELDVSISGKGFFSVTQPDGTISYTRDGSFQRSSIGEIVTAQGYPINPGITIPENAVSIAINENGEVVSTLSDSTTSILGQLEVVSFINQAGLEPISNNLYIETPASGSPVAGIAGQDGLGSITQGFIEGSNVVAVTELTDLIKAQRAFEMNLKVMEAADESLQAVNQSA